MKGVLRDFYAVVIQTTLFFERTNRGYEVG